MKISSFLSFLSFSRVRKDKRPEDILRPEHLCDELSRGLRGLLRRLPGCQVSVGAHGTELLLTVSWSGTADAPRVERPFSCSLDGKDDIIYNNETGDDSEVLEHLRICNPQKQEEEQDKIQNVDNLRITNPQKPEQVQDERQEREEKPDRSGRIARMMRDLSAFLTSRYVFRFNAITEQTEYAALDPEGRHGRFIAADSRSLNTISLDAMEAGIKCWDRDVRRIVESSRVETYHPFHLYLDELPEWDGTDRVGLLARMVSADATWTNAFRRWMLGMTAQWAGVDSLYANSAAPILVSTRQGWGKSTFCRLLLPPELSRYYTESYDLRCPSSAERKLTEFGLVNLDEFDSLPLSRMPMLKNLMQTKSLTLRKAYRRDAQELPRIASFIGTSNRRDLLTDASGSRRFICVELERPIDFTAVNADKDFHRQLYAQLMSELSRGEHYWLSGEEEEEVQRSNRRFYRESAVSVLFSLAFETSREGESGARLLTAAELYSSLLSRHRSAMRGVTLREFARTMPEVATRVHTKFCNGYWVKEKSGGGK